MLERSSIVKRHERPLTINGLARCQFRYNYRTEQWEHKRPTVEAPMTVCIAALCEDSKSVIAVTDRKMSSEYGDTDSALFKWKQIHPQWAVMFAASDVTPIPDIISAATRRMVGSDGSVEAARANITEAYKNVRLKKAEDLYLASRGWTLEDFRTKGRSLLGDTLFLQIERGIINIDLGVSLLVMGVAEKTCHIFSVENPAISEDRSIPGFHAIGSGSHNALSCLYQRALKPATYVQKALYYLYEAKKYAEKVGSVGDKTDIWIMRPDELQRGWVKSEKLEKELEAVWKEVQPKDVNLKVLEKLIQAMKPETPPPSGEVAE